MPTLKDKYAIIGIGHTDYSLNSGRSEFQLALEAIMAAIQDAGLECKDIDGIIGDYPNRVDAMGIASALGLPRLGFFIEPEYNGGGAPSGLLHAIAGMEGGRADYVVCYKSLNGASRQSLPSMEMAVKPYELGFTRPFGLLGPEAYAALSAQRYMNQYGTTSLQLGAVALACRKHANHNPNAIMHGESMTIHDHQNSDLIADPLRRLDCCVEADGAAALVVTAADRAKDLKQPLVYIMAAAQACNGSLSTGIKDPEIMENETRLLGHDLFSTGGIKPQDVDVLQIYDDFTHYVLMALEDLGFCKKGEGGGLAGEGQITWPDGKFPLNTSGGSLSEGCIEGFNHMVEAVKQMRGTSFAQVKDAEIALVCGATDTAVSGLILRR